MSCKVKDELRASDSDISISPSSIQFPGRLLLKKDIRKRPVIKTVVPTRWSAVASAM